MSLTKDQIEHIAKLARLRLAPEDIAIYQEQLGSILEYVDKLNELKTENVPELAFAVGSDNVFRADEAQACHEATRRGLIDAFPLKQGDLLEVQAVFADRTE